MCPAMQLVLVARDVNNNFLSAWVEVRLPNLLFRCNPVHGEPDIRELFDFDQLHWEYVLYPQ